MRLVCPSCGALHSAEGWINDTEAREALAATAALPPPVARWALQYIALFRPPRRALTWARARRLLVELRELVEAPEIRWNLEPPRPSRPEAWAQAMERVVCHPPKELPLGNHNYLRKIAYRIADELDAQAERYREAEITRRRIEEMSREEIERNRERIKDLAKSLERGAWRNKEDV